MKTLELGNNEKLSTGIYLENDGTFLALTYTKSRKFKTRRGAEKWLEKRGF